MTNFAILQGWGCEREKQWTAKSGLKWNKTIIHVDCPSHSCLRHTRIISLTAYTWLRNVYGRSISSNSLGRISFAHPNPRLLFASSLFLPRSSVSVERMWYKAPLISSQSHGDSVSATVLWESAKRRPGPNGLAGQRPPFTMSRKRTSTRRRPLPAPRSHPSVDKQLPQHGLAEPGSFKRNRLVKRLSSRILSFKIASTLWAQLLFYRQVPGSCLTEIGHRIYCGQIHRPCDTT